MTRFAAAAPQAVAGWQAQAFTLPCPALFLLQAFEQAYPALAQRAGAAQAGAFDSVEASKLAAQLNSLTVPGARLRLEQLRSGQTLQTADGGTLKVLNAG